MLIKSVEMGKHTSKRWSQVPHVLNALHHTRSKPDVPLGENLEVLFTGGGRPTIEVVDTLIQDGYLIDWRGHACPVCNVGHLGAIHAR